MTISDAQIAELYERLAAGRSSQASDERVFLRGWNAAIEFAIRALRQSCDEPEPPDAA